MTLSYSARGLSAVCDCGISLSYSFTVFDFFFQIRDRPFGFLVVEELFFQKLKLDF